MFSLKIYRSKEQTAKNSMVPVLVVFKCTNKASLKLIEDTRIHGKEHHPEEMGEHAYHSILNGMPTCSNTLDDKINPLDSTFTVDGKCKHN